MPESEWGPKPAGIIAVGLAGLLLLVACTTLATDAPGRFLSGVAGAGLLMFAAGSWRAQPKLAIAPEGLEVHGWLRTVTLQRSDIALIRITEFRRIGRKVRLLEIDTESGQLIVLSRWDLGGDPIEVLDALTEAGYAGRPG